MMRAPDTIPRMHRLVQTIGGLWELLLLAARSRFRMRSRYWNWRRETAFGGGAGDRPTPAEVRRAVIDYGRWVFRMKRL